MGDSGNTNSKPKLRLVPPPRDARVESRDALRRFRESVDLEDEVTQPEIHFHVDQALPKPPSVPPIPRQVVRVLAAIVALLGALAACAESLRRLWPLIH